jgi:glucosylceramidase
MQERYWTRRRILQGGVTCAAAVALPRGFAEGSAEAVCVTTTASAPWQYVPVAAKATQPTALNLDIDLTRTAQTMEGFGACFNELGWTSLVLLNEVDRSSILRELFDPTADGARFTLCRMPVGANDFSLKPYSYDETPGDFALKDFSIDNDRATLMPFIHAAQRYQKDLRLWASPWTPPSWMKTNNYYAGGPAPGKPGYTPTPKGNEDAPEDMFVLDERNLRAYAVYFGRFIDAYRAEGIRIGMVMPQNEFVARQKFPSCTWSPAGLAKFLHYLGPEMQKRGVEIFFGTMNWGSAEGIASVFADKAAAQYVKGLGLQWAGKNALPALRERYPQLRFYQTEQECGDGKNMWEYTTYCWQLMKHYLRSGVSAYMYWNLALEQGRPSTWGWLQNSLVSVDASTRSFRYTHDYYLMKHLSRFVQVGARRVETSGTCDDALAFINPDGSIVAVLGNETSALQSVRLSARGRTLGVKLAPQSISTVSWPASHA